MIEIAMTIAGVFLMGRVASIEGRSPVLWAAVTFALCVGAMFAPWPLLRIVLAVVAALAIMMAAKCLGKSPVA